MPSASRLVSVLRRGHIPLRTRRDLLLADARRRLRPTRTYAVAYGPGSVYLTHDDYGVDWESLKFVVADEAYAGDHAGAVVLDLGAHKGYYGAYAIANGARLVVSFEPEPENVELLERAARTFRNRSIEWRVRAAAVGASSGEADLHVMRGSWGHALDPPESWAKYEVGTRRVPVEALTTVLAEARADAAGSPIVVKINIEGAECDAVLGTPPEAWTGVTEVFVETHSWARCGPAELTNYLARLGFSELPSAMDAVLRLRRVAAPRSRSHTAPR